MEKTYIQLNIANIITIALCGLIGYGLLVVAGKAVRKVKGGNNA